MAYNKTVWVNDSTPAINATNLNNIENGIETNDTSIGNISELETTATNLTSAINEIILKYQKLVPTVLYDNSSGTYGSITLSDSVANYSTIEIYFHTNDGTGFRGCQKVHVSSGITIMSLIYIHPLTGNYYIKIREVNIQGNQITTNWSKELYSGGMSDKDIILIDKVLAYKQIV